MSRISCDLFVFRIVIKWNGDMSFTIHCHWAHSHAMPVKKQCMLYRNVVDKWFYGCLTCSTRLPPNNLPLLALSNVQNLQNNVLYISNKSRWTKHCREKPRAKTLFQCFFENRWNYFFSLAWISSITIDVTLANKRGSKRVLSLIFHSRNHYELLNC